MKRLMLLGCARTIALSALVLLAPELTSAAFEWEHASPRSLIAGESPARWPVAGTGKGIRADVITARPWGIPGVHAAALRIAGSGRMWTAGAAVAQLRAPAYRESRLAIGIEQIVREQRFALTASYLAAAVGEPAIHAASGMEIDLGWSAALGILDISARADGAFRTHAARKLAPPRKVRLALGSESEHVRSEVHLDEGSRGRRLGVGLLLHPLPALVVGAAWSSDEPPVRLLVGVSRSSFALNAGWAWHSTLPPSHIVALSYRSSAKPASSP